MNLDVLLSTPLHSFHGLRRVALIVSGDHGFPLLPRLLVLAKDAIKRGNDLPRHDNS